jgi:hypothetical protein
MQPKPTPSQLQNPSRIHYNPESITINHHQPTNWPDIENHIPLLAVAPTQIVVYRV